MTLFFIFFFKFRDNVFTEKLNVHPSFSLKYSNCTQDTLIISKKSVVVQGYKRVSKHDWLWVRTRGNEMLNIFLSLLWCQGKTQR